MSRPQSKFGASSGGGWLDEVLEETGTSAPWERENATNHSDAGESDAETTGTDKDELLAPNPWMEAKDRDPLLEPNPWIDAAEEDSLVRPNPWLEAKDDDDALLQPNPWLEAQPGVAEPPRDAPVESPAIEVKPAPKAEATPAAKAEAKPAPEAEAEPAPKAEAKPAPEAEAEPAPKAEAKPAPKAEAKPALKAEAKPALKAEAKPAPKAEAKPAPKAEAKPALKAEAKPAPKAKAKPAPKAEAKPAPKAKAKPAPKAEAKPAPKAKAKPAPKAEAKPAPKAEAKPAPKAKAKPAPKAEAKPAPKAEAKPAPKAEAKPAPKAAAKPAPKAEAKPAPKAEAKPAPKAEAKPAPKPKAVAKAKAKPRTPRFKRQPLLARCDVAPLGDQNDLETEQGYQDQRDYESTVTEDWTCHSSRLKSDDGPNARAITALIKISALALKQNSVRTTDSDDQADENSDSEVESDFTPTDIASAAGTFNETQSFVQTEIPAALAEDVHAQHLAVTPLCIPTQELMGQPAARNSGCPSARLLFGRIPIAPPAPAKAKTPSEGEVELISADPFTCILTAVPSGSIAPALIDAHDTPDASGATPG